MILFNQYKTVESEPDRNNTEYDKIYKIICEKNKIYETDDYIFYKFNSEIDTESSILNKTTSYKQRDKLIPMECRNKLTQLFNYSLTSNYEMRIYKYIFYKQLENPCEFFKNMINNQVDFIEFYKYRNSGWYNTPIINFIFIHKKYIKKHSYKCGISKNNRISKLIVKYILRNNFYNFDFKILLLDYFKWIDSYGNDSRKQLYEKYISIKKDINICCKYIAQYSYYTEDIIYHIFIQYILLNGINKFIDNIIIGKLTIYDRKKYEKILDIIYETLLDNKILLCVIPDIKNKIINYLKYKIKIKRNSIVKYMYKIHNYKQTGLEKKIKNCIKDTQFYSNNTFSITYALDLEYKKYFFQIKQLILELKRLQIHIDAVTK